ncbi:capsular biosynthesis protein [Macrococcus sp. DPC7161]|uniref:capsular biosynthesis protein n=1 Tax=Macrococcus sp. DPC7161 TaxID=2507060 RepID=UPI00100B921A|nr:capsular biosynthesis protein [Macrococcus sp. DPC7161]RXK17228.1 capsular biosynthesis protein [Macrococcus sp. DPC7161]
MRIAILAATNIRHMTLISHYLKNINLNKHDLDIIYMDRYSIDEEILCTNKYKIECKMSQKDSKVRKVRQYLKFKKEATDIIKNKDYELIIVWGSYTAHLFKNILIKQFKHKYILNIRDYFFENNRYIFHRMSKLVKNSLFTTVSSDGFLNFLPKSNKYRMIHSLNDGILSNDKICVFKKNYPIKISFIGNVRFFDVNKKLIEVLGNDKRFILQYFGTGTDMLQQYAQENNISNIEFLNGFNVNQTLDLLKQTDIINNIYGNNNVALDTALSIRLYYSLFLKIPILTTVDTYTNEFIEETGLSYAVDINKLEGIGSEIFKWYNELNTNEISEKAENKVKEIKYTNQKVYNEFLSLIGD